jgi:hypothetical protein
MLRGHVGLPRDVKEVDFFVKNYARGIEWYKGYFAGCDPRLPAGEICPSYLGSNAARDRIAEHIPGCRIICTLRDPLEVLFSFWKLARRNAWTTHDFESYTPDGWETGSGLRAWFDTFGRENVLVLIYDDLEAGPQTYLNRVCDFIGIARIAAPDSAREVPRVNSFSRMPRSQYLARKARKLRDRLQSGEYYRTINLLTRAGVWRFCFDGGAEFPTLDPAVEHRIRQRLRPQVEELEALLGRDFGLWKVLRADAERTQGGAARASG